MKKKLNCVLLVDDNESDNFLHKRIIEKANITDNVEYNKLKDVQRECSIKCVNSLIHCFLDGSLWGFPKVLHELSLNDHPMKGCFLPTPFAVFGDLPSGEQGNQNLIPTS